MLDGTKEAAGKAKQMLYWDVNNGVARRAWSGNSFAQQQISEEMQRNPNFIVTLPHTANTSIIDNIIK
jgi:urocanate hydratase